MDSVRTPVTPPTGDEETALQEVLGYLNFSTGKPDARFQRHCDTLHALLKSQFPETSDGVDRTVGVQHPPLRDRLLTKLAALRTSAAPFRDSHQAEAVIGLVFDAVLPAYVRHHADLLFHLNLDDFLQPFFFARVCEAVLAQGAGTDVERVKAGALQQLNDFLGHRPVAVLENRRQMQPYAHERFRPIPLYVREAGVAHGKHQAVIEQALVLLKQTPADILQSASFELSRMDELALDVRAYDHSHPVYRRTNYTFGEWDPQCINISGRYSRFVVRAIILEALHDWMAQAKELSPEEKLYEAGAVLAGTILMASAVSGSGPDTHDSSVSLTSLLPRIARQRDAFYQRLLQAMTGPHAERLRKEAQAVQQPFGKIRQHLNLHLAHYGCRQMQRSHLAFLYARMGYPQASRHQAEIIPSTSVRFETEIQWRITNAHLDLDRSMVAPAAARLDEIQALLHRGIACGALVDPWNILGFQGQFPLFQSREDSVADQRVEKLLGLMEQTFVLYSRVRCEAAAAGEFAKADEVAFGFRKLAEYWDQFASTTVNDLPAVHGMESYNSAAQVTDVLVAWFKAGEAAGDMAFWRRHVLEFDSAKSFAIVTDVLLRKRDLLASMGLLVQWVSQGDTAQLETGQYSYFPLAERWMNLAVHEGNFDLARKFLDYLEANAGDYWSVPRLDERFGITGTIPTEAGHAAEPDDEPLGDENEEELFSAAYDHVTYRDSTADGNQGDTLDSGPVEHDTAFDELVQPLELRLRFLMTLARLWQTAAVSSVFAPRKTAEASGKPAAAPVVPVRTETIEHWYDHCQRILTDLDKLAESLHTWTPTDPSGDPDSLMEFDRQLHLKVSLLNNVMNALLTFREAARVLSSCLPPAPRPGLRREFDREVLVIQRLVLEGKAPELRRLLPGFLKELARKPLLYIPFDRGGKPRDILAARDLQSLLRMLLRHLPRLGLQRETWHVLRTAYQMERTSPPPGMSITEFDRLLQAALRSALESVVHASSRWPRAGLPPIQVEPLPGTIVDPLDRERTPNDDDLILVFRDLTEVYRKLWFKHSETMRLSSVEALKDRDTWKRVKNFITSYGGDLFHAQVLTLSNMRAIVHRDVDEYLDYLQENEDPLHPIKLLADLGSEISREDACYLLDLIFRCVVEKFDRFMEYNTTTTHSDYGEQLHCLLDFLRLEADYERQAWNMVPLVLAHEVLLREGRSAAAAFWHNDFVRNSATLAKGPLSKLKKLEKLHGLRLPSITDRLNERYIKPLALDRILALVRPAMRDARLAVPEHPDCFDRLQTEIEQYLSTTSGSAMDLQPWLQNLADEVHEVEDEGPLGDSQLSDRVVPEIPLSLEDLRSQLEVWDKPLAT